MMSEDKDAKMTDNAWNSGSISEDNVQQDDQPLTRPLCDSYHYNSRGKDISSMCHDCEKTTGDMEKKAGKITSVVHKLNAACDNAEITIVEPDTCSMFTFHPTVEKDDSDGEQGNIHSECSKSSQYSHLEDRKYNSNFPLNGNSDQVEDSVGVCDSLVDELAQIDETPSRMVDELAQIDETSRMVDELAQIDETSRMVDELAQIDETPSRMVDELAQIDETSSRMVDEPAQIDETPSRMVDELAQIDETPSRMVDEPAQIDKISSRMVDEHAQIDETSSRMVDELAQIDETSSRMVDEPAQIHQMFSRMVDECIQFASRENCFNAVHKSDLVHRSSKLRECHVPSVSSESLENQVELCNVEERHSDLFHNCRLGLLIEESCRKDVNSEARSLENPVDIPACQKHHVSIAACLEKPVDDIPAFLEDSVDDIPAFLEDSVDDMPACLINPTEDHVGTTVFLEDPVYIHSSLDDSVNIPSSLEDPVEDPIGMPACLQDPVSIPSYAEDLVDISASLEDCISIPACLEDPVDVHSSSEDPIDKPASLDDHVHTCILQDTISIPVCVNAAPLRAKKKKKKKLKLERHLQKLYIPCNDSHMKYASSFKELLPSPEDKFHPDFMCPVCLELYHRPHVITPCRHMFCEPCLRKLPSSIVADTAVCPLCRHSIQTCILDMDLHVQLRSYYAQIYECRARLEKRLKTNQNPLPRMSAIPLPQRLIRRIFRNSQSQRSNSRIFRNIQSQSSSNSTPWSDILHICLTVCLSGCMSVLFAWFNIPVEIGSGSLRSAAVSNIWVQTVCLFILLSWFFRMFLRTFAVDRG